MADDLIYLVHFPTPSTKLNKTLNKTLSKKPVFLYSKMDANQS